MYLYNSWYICNHKRIIIGLYFLMLLFALKHIFIYCIHAGTSTLMDTFFMKKTSKNRWRKIQTESMEHSLRNWVGPSFCSFLWSMIKTVICWWACVFIKRLTKRNQISYMGQTFNASFWNVYAYHSFKWINNKLYYDYKEK